MKITNPNSRWHAFLGCLVAAVLLTKLGAGHAQSLENTPATVSDYPSDPALLPGKGSAIAWSGLPAKYKERHAEWAPHVAEDHGAVVFLGDSITEGWRTVAKQFPNYKVANRGIGGDTTRGILYRLKADVLALDPEAVVLLIGTNDIGNGSDPDDIADNIRAIIAALRAHSGRMPIIVCKVMPASDTNRRPPDKIKKLNADLDNIVKGDPNLFLVDTWSIFAGPDGNSKKEEFPDLLHPNAGGYAKWKAALDPVFAKLNLPQNK